MTKAAPRRPGRTKTSLSRSIWTRVSPDFHRRVRLRAAEEDRSISEVVVSALKQYLARPADAAPKMKGD